MIKSMARTAPDFTLKDQNGRERSLKDYASRWLVLYFYPKDDTPGCTTEACNFRDNRDSIASLGNAEVVGVSKDSVRKHANFVKKYNLNFTLLSDPEATTIKAYNSWGERKLFGKTFMGILRNTFIISPDGQIVKQYLGVDPATHATEIIKDLTKLQKSQV
jgi:peroxiredoxin Q/BCP